VFHSLLDYTNIMHSTKLALHPHALDLNLIHAHKVTCTWTFSGTDKQSNQARKNRFFA